MKCLTLCTFGTQTQITSTAGQRTNFEMIQPQPNNDSDTHRPKQYVCCRTRECTNTNDDEKGREREHNFNLHFKWKCRRRHLNSTFGTICIHLFEVKICDILIIQAILLRFPLLWDNGCARAVHLPSCIWFAYGGILRAHFTCALAALSHRNRMYAFSEWEYEVSGKHLDRWLSNCIVIFRYNISSCLCIRLWFSYRYKLTISVRSV